MSPVVRIVLAIAALLAVIVCVMVGCGWWYWSHHGEEIMQAGKQASMQGSADGAHLDEAGCLTEAVDRHRQHPPEHSIVDSIADSTRFRGCLNASRAAGDFCNGVPAPGSIVQIVSWSQRRCAAVPTRDSDCPSLMQEVASYCASKERAAKLGR